MNDNLEGETLGGAFSKVAADAFNTELGKKLRRRRRLLGMTQAEVGEQIGLRFQQVQKYETGVNRVTVVRLFDLAQALKTDPRNLLPEPKNVQPPEELPAAVARLASNWPKLTEAQKATFTDFIDFTLNRAGFNQGNAGGFAFKK